MNAMSAHRDHKDTYYIRKAPARLGSPRRSLCDIDGIADRNRLQSFAVNGMYWSETRAANKFLGFAAIPIRLPETSQSLHGPYSPDS